MRVSIVQALLLIILTIGAAEARPDARKMSCAKIQALVKNAGTAVVTTGAHTFDKFVAHGGFCGRRSTYGPKFVKTTDNAKCPLNHCRAFPRMGN